MIFLWTKVDKETGTCTKVDKTDKGWFGGWFTDWFSKILWKKVSKEGGIFTKVEKE